MRTFEIRVGKPMRAFSMRFQREFDKDKYAVGSVKGSMTFLFIFRNPKIAMRSKMS